MKWRKPFINSPHSAFLYFKAAKKTCNKGLNKGNKVEGRSANVSQIKAQSCENTI